MSNDVQAFIIAIEISLSNYEEMRLDDQILTLIREGHSFTSIARMLGITRERAETVFAENVDGDY